MNHKDVFTTHQVADLLSVDMSTVITWIDRQKLAGFRTPGGHRRVTRTDLLSFLKTYHMPAPADWGAGPTILLVEDEADFRGAMARMIKARRPDAAVHEAEDGFLAGKRLQELKPSLVVLDLFLPGLDGFTVCRHIRQDASLNGTRILAMSGYGTPENRRRILQAGADDFLSKTAGLAALAEKVDRLLAREARPMAV